MIVPETRRHRIVRLQVGVAEAVRRDGGAGMVRTKNGLAQVHHLQVVASGAGGVSTDQAEMRQVLESVHGIYVPRTQLLLAQV